MEVPEVGEAAMEVVEKEAAREAAMARGSGWVDVCGRGGGAGKPEKGWADEGRGGGKGPKGAAGFKC